MIILTFKKNRETKTKEYKNTRLAILAIRKLHDEGKNRLEPPQKDDKYFSLIGIEDESGRVPVFANMLTESKKEITQKNMAFAIREVMKLKEKPDYVVVRKLEKTWH